MTDPDLVEKKLAVIETCVLQGADWLEATLSESLQRMRTSGISSYTVTPTWI